jgi:hypothetical protein
MNPLPVPADACADTAATATSDAITTPIAAGNRRRVLDAINPPDRLFGAWLQSR